jgi:transposase
MAGSYSADLRGRVLAAAEAGATPGAAARRFVVGRSTAYRWAAEARTEGRRAAKRVGGPSSAFAYTGLPAARRACASANTRNAEARLARPGVASATSLTRAVRRSPRARPRPGSPRTRAPA